MTNIIVLLILVIWPGQAFSLVETRTRQGCTKQNCRVSNWSDWSFCSQPCGLTGVQTKTRQKTTNEYCQGTCQYSLTETRPCNRNSCKPGGLSFSYAYSQAPECSSYTPINDITRKTSYNGSVVCDYYIIPVNTWCRFTTPGSTKMPESCVAKNYCGTLAPGWLSGHHPTVAEGIVTRFVCYHWSSGCCQWNNTIRVRNCGSFYVYELQQTPGCYLRYCTADTDKCSSSPCQNNGTCIIQVGGYKCTCRNGYNGTNCEIASAPAPECSSYMSLNDATRQTSFRGSVRCDQTLAKKWYRFTTPGSSRMPETCIAKHYCGTQAPGWLSGRHPTVAEGVVTRRVCYHWGSNCCNWKNNIRIRNCGAFYVYELQGPPRCPLRYCTADPCSREVHKEIKNWQRSSSYISASALPGFHYLCDDNLVEGWYRFTSNAGGQMPTSCPQPKSCGTEMPLWLQGRHPTLAEGIKNMTVCLRTESGCCNSTKLIKVLKCQTNGNADFFVYRLTNVERCPRAYCAGKEVPCPNGFNSKTGFTPNCTDKFPRLTKDPILTVHVVNHADQRIAFRCQFKSNCTTENCRFEVTWYHNAMAYKLKGKTLLQGIQRTAELINTHKLFNGIGRRYFLGDTIFCRVRSYYVTSPSTKSAYYESNHYYAGVKVAPDIINKTLTLTEKQPPIKFNLTTTVPIVCENGKLNGCYLKVTVGQSQTSDINRIPGTLDARISTCGIIFKPSVNNQSREIEVAAVRDFLDDNGDKLMYIGFKVKFHSQLSDWIEHKPIGHVKVVLKNIGTARCFSSGDPHITTFDGLYYNHYRVGDYVLAKSTSRRFEVHVRTWKCWNVACNCGVAVREGDEIMVIDMCRNGIPRPRFVSTAETEGAEMKRDSTGRSFVMNFPSGAFVKADFFSWYGTYFTNLIVQVPSDDYQATVGLCGTFDGDSSATNELVSPSGQSFPQLAGYGVADKRFTESWRLPPGQSLFYLRRQKGKCPTQRIKYHCTCNCDNKEGDCLNPKVNCNFKGYAERPKFASYGNEYATLDFPGAEHCGRRRRRAIDDNKYIILPDDDSIGNYTYDPDTNENFTIPAWPTPKGKTESGVKNHCRTALLNSPSGKVCSKLPSLNVDKFVKQCVEDVMLTDDYSVVKAAMDIMQSSCEEISLRNMSLWKPDPSKNGTIGPPAEIGNSLCPGQCNGNGDCINSTCICNKGYKSADCSIEAGRSPTLNKIPLDGLCDKRARDCKRTRIIGSNFIESENLTCRITEVKLSEGQSNLTSTIFQSRGYLLSFAEVMCELPTSSLYSMALTSDVNEIPAKGYVLEVSNDKVNFSKTKVMYVVYDSKCLDCSTDSKGINCKIVAGTCNIAAKCYWNKEVNPHNFCEICNTTEASNKFVFLKENRQPQWKMPKTNWTLYIGVEFRLQLDVEDYEKFSIKVSVNNNTLNATIVPSRILRLLPTNSFNTALVIKAEDKCGKISNLDLHLVILPCPCKNGICQQRNNIFHSNNTGTLPPNCICLPGYTGGNCEEDINECLSSPCVSNAICHNINGSYNCICKANYTGKTCENGETKTPPPSKENEETKQRKQKQNTTIIIGCTIGGVFFIILGILLVVIITKKLQSRSTRIANNYPTHGKKDELEKPKLRRMQWTNHAYVEDMK